MPNSFILDKMFGTLPSEQCCIFNLENLEVVGGLDDPAWDGLKIASDGYFYTVDQIKQFNQQADKNNICSPHTGEILLLDNNDHLLVYPAPILKNAIYMQLSKRYSLERYKGSKTFFANNFLTQAIESFVQKNYKIHEITDLNVRNIFSNLANNESSYVKYLLNKTPNLALTPVTADGEYLLHIFTAIGDVDMVKFLVEQLKIPISQPTQHGLCILFYLEKNTSLEIVRYWHQQSMPLSFLTPTNVDLLIHAIVMQDVNLLEEIFKLGYVVPNQAKYLGFLENVLSTANYEIIAKVVEFLSSNSEIINSINFIELLAKNVLLNEEQFHILFDLSKDYVLERKLKTNPYNLGVISLNSRYLKALSTYCQKNGLPNIINDKIGNNFELPLGLAIDLEFTPQIKLLLSLGASPNISYKKSKSYALARALLNNDLPLFMLLKQYSVNIQDLLVIEIVPLLFRANSFPTEELKYILVRMEHENLEKIFGGSVSLIILGIINFDNMHLLKAFIELKAINQKFFDVLALDAHDNNPLHASVGLNNIEFSKYFIELNPQFLVQENFYNDTPLTLALKKASPELIEICLNELERNFPEELPKIISTHEQSFAKDALLTNPHLACKGCRERIGCQASLNCVTKPVMQQLVTRLAEAGANKRQRLGLKV